MLKNLTSVHMLKDLTSARGNRGCLYVRRGHACIQPWNSICALSVCEYWLGECENNGAGKRIIVHDVCMHECMPCTYGLSMGIRSSARNGVGHVLIH
jgi:hypothetical protein